ncbi:MAG: DUF6798 domain-containing protein [Pirellulaceae bacterium]
MPEVALIFLLFYLYAGGPPPDVNEAHYLAKARHYWDPSWCPGDHFLDSRDAHLVFNWTFGWLTRLFPLPAVAWIGRVLTWGLLAWAWRRLSVAVVPVKLMSLLSAALMLVLLRNLHLAGEWMVGGVEAKGFAFVLVLLGLEAMVRDRWRSTWLLLGAASAFHVLVGGWTVIAVGVAWLWRGRGRPSLVSMLPALIGGLLLALPGLISGLLLTIGVETRTVELANQIYVFERLSHHLVVPWRDGLLLGRTFALFTIWLVMCVLTWRMEAARRLNGYVLGAVLIALTGAAIDLTLRNSQPELAASLLRYYWFRTSDVALPLGTALGACALAAHWRAARPRVTEAALSAAILLAAVGIGEVVCRRMLDPRPLADAQSLPTGKTAEDRDKIYRDWKAVCRWIREETPPDARFLTPQMQQTFKWYAQRSEAVTWKDVPQDAPSLVEWWRRYRILYPEYPDQDGTMKRGLAAYDDANLAILAHHYGAQYVVIDRTRSRYRPSFHLMYPDLMHDNATYAVYKIPDPLESPTKDE